MSMTADLRDRLIAANIVSERVFRDERTQGSPLPAFRLQTVSDPRPSTHEGRQALRATTVQLDSMASSRGAADANADAAIAAVEPATTVGATTFSRSFVDASRTYSERDSANVLIFVTSIDLIVWHQPAA